MKGLKVVLEELAGTGEATRTLRAVLTDFVAKVRTMRRATKAYFRVRSRDTLMAARAAEGVVDQMVKELAPDLGLDEQEAPKGG